MGLIMAIDKSWRMESTKGTVSITLSRDSRDSSHMINCRFEIGGHKDTRSIAIAMAVKEVLHLWTLFLKTVCIFSKNKATSGKVLSGSD